MIRRPPRSTPTKQNSILHVSRIPFYELIDINHRIFGGREAITALGRWAKLGPSALLGLERRRGHPLTDAIDSRTRNRLRVSLRVALFGGIDGRLRPQPVIAPRPPKRPRAARPTW